VNEILTSHWVIFRPQNIGNNENGATRMYKNTTALSVAISLALGTASLSPLAFAEEQQVEQLQKMKVTGSRISTTQMEGPSPVTVITSKDIAAKGFNSAQDILNSL